MSASNALKKLVVGTPLELPLRRLMARLNPSSAGRRSTADWGLRRQRDDADLDVLLPRLLRADSTCVDIGANDGEFLDRFIGVCPQGRHYGFEPIPHLAKALRERYAGNQRISIEQCAVSDTQGEATFHHAIGLADWSGLKEQAYPSHVKVEKIPVRLVRLDDVIPADTPVDLIKIDVEGAELSVFKGAERIIRKDRPHIIFEHAQVHNESYGTTPEMVHDLLCGEFGLQMFSLNGKGPYSKGQFGDLYRHAHRYNYDRTSETNFLATAADARAIRGS